MPNRQSNAVYPHLWRLVHARIAGHRTDREALERYLGWRDPAAFAELVQRHGGMVLRVCQRVLNNPDDVEDAFQATFLVLVRKARSIAKWEALGSWLYGVAYRVARKARAEAARRQGHEKLAAGPATHQVGSEEDWFEVRPIIDEEVNRLPEKYRRPIVLCYFEGKTYEEAARLLGWPAGTASVRLARARELLRIRLTRRGLALSAGALAAGLAKEAVAATELFLPGEAAGRTVLSFAAGGGTADISIRVVALAKGVLKAMVAHKLKAVVAVLVAIGVSCIGAGLVGRLAVETPAEAADPQGKMLAGTEALPASPARPGEGARREQAPSTRPLAPPRGAWAAQMRLGLVNMTQVLRAAKKFRSVQAGLRARAEQVRKDQEGLKTSMRRYQTEVDDPATTANRRNQVAGHLRQLERELEDRNRESARELADLQGKALTQMYRDVEEAANRVAKRDGLELVMFYTDAVTEADFYQPNNLQRKLTQPGALMPLIVAPGMDITDTVVEALNLQSSTKGS
jgi:RNA polymerase sigma factor (sigma-70 family)